MRLAGRWRLLAAIAPLAACGLLGALASRRQRSTPTRRRITADDLPTWQTNGIVWAMAQADGVVFAGGTFSAIRPPGRRPAPTSNPR